MGKPPLCRRGAESFAILANVLSLTLVVIRPLLCPRWGRGIGAHLVREFHKVRSNRFNAAFSIQCAAKQSFICHPFRRPLAIGPKDEVANPSIRQVLAKKMQIVVLVWLFRLRREPDQFDNFIPSEVWNGWRTARCCQFSKLFGAASAVERPEERLIIRGLSVRACISASSGAASAR